MKPVPRIRSVRPYKILPTRYYARRGASELRESAAALCERMAEVAGSNVARLSLERAAWRIRRIPVAGFIGKHRKP